jgi:chitin synthase
VRAIKPIPTGCSLLALLTERWLYQAFGRILEPEICIQLDVGAKPQANCVLEIWRTFNNSKSLGAAYGRVKVRPGTYGLNVLNPLVAAHRFEDEISDFLPQPFDLLGFLSSPPSPLFAYRYKLLADPMARYLLGDNTYAQKRQKGEAVSSEETTAAGNRILQLEVAASCSVTLVRGAKVELEAPFDIEGSIAQRQEWVNQQIATWIYLSHHFVRLLNSTPTFINKLIFLLNVLRQLVVLTVRWFKVANAWLIVNVILDLTSREKSSVDSTIVQGHAGSFSLLMKLMY